MHTFLETLKKTVNPQTMAVGVKFIKDISTLKDVKVKLKGHKIAVCQQISYSRYYGWSTLCTAADSHCVLGASNTGLVEKPERVVNGSVNCNVYQKNEVAAKMMQEMMPKVEEDFEGFLTFPLERSIEGFAPDVIVIYMNSAQAMRMTQAFLYQNGGELTFSTSGDAGVCSRCVAESFTKQKPVVEIPCLGDRRFAKAQNDELAVGFPIAMLEQVTEGLNATHKAGIRYPIPFEMSDECHLPPTFTTTKDDL